MKFEIEIRNRNVPDEDLIKDVQDVSKRIGRNTVTIAEYKEFGGKYNPSTLTRRFRSWFTVLAKAGLQESRLPFNISHEKLFDNMEDVWISLGRQPKRVEMKTPLSKYSAGTYYRRFGSWQKALEEFIEYINDDSTEEEEPRTDETREAVLGEKDRKKPKRTKREISQRLRFSILMRDGFRCRSCGRGTIEFPGQVVLHVDHIIPWSKGGESTPENLQVKCQKCNLGKGNAFDK